MDFASSLFFAAETTSWNGQGSTLRGNANKRHSSKTKFTLILRCVTNTLNYVAEKNLTPRIAFVGFCLPRRLCALFSGVSFLSLIYL